MSGKVNYRRKSIPYLFTCEVIEEPSAEDLAGVNGRGILDGGDERHLVGGGAFTVHPAQVGDSVRVVGQLEGGVVGTAPAHCISVDRLTELVLVDEARRHPTCRRQYITYIVRHEVFRTND